MLYKWVKQSAVFAALVLFVGCARQGPPPGGPADMTPPYVMATVPQNDSVCVGTQTAIQVHFSETMDRNSVEEAIFISPQSAQKPKFKWRGDVLEIRLADGLRPDRTYVVTVGQASADEWRNRMLASRTFRFATGDQVNDGELFGRVVLSKEQTGQTFAWLFDLAVAPEPDLIQTVAHYVTQPDAEGHFQFTGLGPGTYRVFVFADANQDKAYSSGLDALAVPVQDVVIKKGQHPFRLGDLKAVVRDTSAPVLSAVRTSDQHHILMRFDEPVRVVSLPVVQGVNVRVVYQDVDSSRVGLFTDLQKGGQSYDLRIGVVDRSGNRAEIKTTVRGDGTADRRVPEVLALQPPVLAAQVLPNASLEIVFSDAMSPDLKQSVWVVSDSTLSPEGQFEWLASNHLLFTSKVSWPLGQVSLKSQKGVFKDLAGNVVDDAIAFDFTVIDSLDVGNIAGNIEVLDAPAVVEAISMETGKVVYRHHVALGDSTFEIRDVLPGMYRVTGFVDANGDGKWARGDVTPFVPAEVLFHASDTVEVPSRWSVDTRRLEAQKGWFLFPTVKDSL